MLKTVFVIAVILFATVHAGPTLNKMSMPLLEDGCVRQGGVCSRIEECDPANLVMIAGISLCPLQRNLGIECCYI